MKINEAKEICKEHCDYVCVGIISNKDYTVIDVGIAIDTVAKAVKEISKEHYKVLMAYNEWRRGYIQEYPRNTSTNMLFLLEAIEMLE